ncbi:hypothetical protein AKK22_08450 [Escherichia coli]|nr:hypothetical protein AKK22_08450 [Escherichia coli]
MKRGYYDFIKKFRGWILSVQILIKPINQFRLFIDQFTGSSVASFKAIFRVLKVIARVTRFRGLECV